VVQLYIGGVTAEVERPQKELKGFCKVQLQPGETEQVVIECHEQAFHYFDPDRSQWVPGSGEVFLSVGFSSQDIRSSQRLCLESIEDTNL
jgi:beta-glucosidase